MSYTRRFQTLSPAGPNAMQRIGFIALPGFQLMSAGVLAVFELANMEMGEPVYDVHLVSETGGSIRSSIGISAATEPFDDTNFHT
jgi:transcriptional regulator GlxA family with amidase domain